MKVVFTGGGTAGHIFPILAIIREIKKIHPVKSDKVGAKQFNGVKPGFELRLFYMGPKDTYGSTLLSKERVKVKRIFTGKLRRYFSGKNFLDLFKIPIGFFQSLFWLFILAPDFVFSKGGHGSFPTVFAARILHIPIFLHESDVTPGLTSRMTSKWALEIFTSFDETEHFPKEKIVCLGNPIRNGILNGNREEAKAIFKLQGGKPLILVLGGSQGSESINNLVLEILPELTTSFEIVHQTGRRNYKEVEIGSGALIGKELKKYYHLFPFLEERELKHILAACDIVISRAGSGALFEIASAGKPSILIPLPGAAQNHQLKNAYQFSGGIKGQVMEEANLKPHFFLERLKYFLSRKDILREMTEKAEDFARPKAAQIIASYLLDYLSQVFSITTKTKSSKS